MRIDFGGCVLSDTEDDFNEAATARREISEALLSAVCGGADEEKCLRLLEKGADPNYCDDFGNVLLRSSIISGKNKVTLALLEKGADPNLLPEVQDRTALMQAARRGDGEIVKALIEKGAKLDVQDRLGWTALIGAEDFCKLDVVKTLLEAGANPDAQDYNGMTALMRASEAGRVESVKALIAGGADTKIEMELENGERWCALSLAIDAGRVDCVQVWVDMGLDIESCAGGRLPLSLAVIRGDAGIFSIIVDKVRDINARDEDGCTAVFSAAWSGHDLMIGWLSEKGADVNLADNAGVTPLMAAAEAGNRNAVTTLLALEADVDRKDHKGRTARDYASDKPEIKRFIDEAVFSRAAARGTNQPRKIRRRGMKL